MQGLAKFLEDGGTLMYVNLVVSIITLAIIIDRAIFFLGKGSVNAKAFLEQIRKLVLANNIDRAVKLCSATEAPVAQVARAGLQRVHRGEIAIAQAIEETLVDVTPLLKKRIQILWSIANIATLVGLLGTVIGLIRAFGAVAAAKPEERSALLAKGISEALNNTAMGLGIAVTCIIAHAFLSSASKKQVGDLEGFALKLENLLAESAQGGATRPKDMTRSQVRAAMRRMRDHNEEIEEEAGEINLVPYMDIVTNIIIFLLASVVNQVALGNINVSSPTISSGGGSAPRAARPRGRRST